MACLQLVPLVVLLTGCLGTQQNQQQQYAAAPSSPTSQVGAPNANPTSGQDVVYDLFLRNVYSPPGPNRGLPPLSFQAPAPAPAPAPVAPPAPSSSVYVGQNAAISFPPAPTHSWPNGAPPGSSASITQGAAVSSVAGSNTGSPVITQSAAISYPPQTVISAQSSSVGTGGVAAFTQPNNSPVSSNTAQTSSVSPAVGATSFQRAPPAGTATAAIAAQTSSVRIPPGAATAPQTTVPGLAPSGSSQQPYTIQTAFQTSQAAPVALPPGAAVPQQPPPAGSRKQPYVTPFSSPSRQAASARSPGPAVLPAPFANPSSRVTQAASLSVPPGAAVPQQQAYLESPTVRDAGIRPLTTNTKTVSSSLPPGAAEPRQPTPMRSLTPRAGSSPSVPATAQATSVPLSPRAPVPQPPTQPVGLAPASTQTAASATSITQAASVSFPPGAAVPQSQPSAPSAVASSFGSPYSPRITQTASISAGSIPRQVAPAVRLAPQPNPTPIPPAVLRFKQLYSDPVPQWPLPPTADINYMNRLRYLANIRSRNVQYRQPVPLFEPIVFQSAPEVYQPPAQAQTVQAVDNIYVLNAARDLDCETIPEVKSLDVHVYHPMGCDDDKCPPGKSCRTIGGVGMCCPPSVTGQAIQSKGVLGQAEYMGFL